MEYLAEGGLLIVCVFLRIHHPVACLLHGFLHDFRRTGGAVVVEEVIAVGAVFFLRVDFQQSGQLLFLGVGEVEHLLTHRYAVVFAVASEEICRLIDREHVVGLTFHEIIDEVVAPAVEHTIVIGEVVKRVVEVADAQRGMSEHLIGVGTRVARDKRHLQVHACGVAHFLNFRFQVFVILRLSLTAVFLCVQRQNRQQHSNHQKK